MLVSRDGTVPARFVPTHELTVGRAGRARRVVPVMLVDNLGYEHEDLANARPASWTFDRGEWIQVTPVGGTDPVVARKLGRGPTAMRGAPSRNRTIRATDAEWRRWGAEAKRAGLSVSEWLRKAAATATVGVLTTPRRSQSRAR